MKNKIKQFLKTKGITPYKFRQDTGIAQRTAYDLYNNSGQLPSSSVLSKICDAYKIQPGEVLEWVSPDKGAEANQVHEESEAFHESPETAPEVSLPSPQLKGAA